MTARVYLVVWATLIALATATLLASEAGAGSLIAFAIAATKAALVLIYFMHLRGGRSLLRIVFATALIFTLLLVLGVLGDVGLRDAASPYVDDLGAR